MKDVNINTITLFFLFFWVTEISEVRLMITFLLILNVGNSVFHSFFVSRVGILIRDSQARDMVEVPGSKIENKLVIIIFCEMIFL